MMALFKTRCKPKTNIMLPSAAFEERQPETAMLARSVQDALPKTWQRAAIQNIYWPCC